MGMYFTIQVHKDPKDYAVHGLKINYMTLVKFRKRTWHTLQWKPCESNKLQGNWEKEYDTIFTSMVPTPSATLQPDIKKGAF